MPEYKPAIVPIHEVPASLLKDVGRLITDFEPRKPDPQYSFSNRTKPGSWDTVVPKTAPPVGDLPELIQNLIKATWKLTEPKATNIKGSHGITIGTRGGAVPAGNANYSPQVRPTHSEIKTTFPNKDAIASDWKLFNWIRRTNAVTFRGDTRSPLQVISEAHGFYPPNTRTDDYYLHNNVINEFNEYLKRRYCREPDLSDLFEVIDNQVTSDSAKNLLVDYMMWRKITEREAVHLGRMVENECLKGYISTARAIDTALHFATHYGAQEGWLYLTVVHSGFVIPLGQQHYWGSQESEIAQWGPIPADRIVGFVHVAKTKIPDGPIFIRRSFRWSEPDAFQRMFKIMSGMTSAQQSGGIKAGLHRLVA